MRVVELGVELFTGIDLAQIVGEPARRRVHVQEACTADTCEGMLHAGRNHDRRPGLRADRVTASCYFEFALQDMEAIGVPEVNVPARTVVLGVDEILEHVELRSLHLHLRKTMLFA